MANWLHLVILLCDEWQALFDGIEINANPSLEYPLPYARANMKMLTRLRYLKKRKEISQLNLEYLKTTDPECLQQIADLFNEIDKDRADIDSYLTAVGMPIDDILRPARLRIEHLTHGTIASHVKSTRTKTPKHLEHLKRRFNLVNQVLEHFMRIYSAGVSRDKAKLLMFLKNIPNSPLAIALKKAPERAFNACSEIGEGTNKHQAFEIISIYEEKATDSIRLGYYKYRKLIESQALENQ